MANLKIPRPRPRRSCLIIGLLLLLQAAALAWFNLANISSQVDFLSEFDISHITVDTTEEQLPEGLLVTVENLFTSILLLPLSVTAFLAAVGFIFQRRFAWVLAMLTQVLALLICLLLYYDSQTYIIYPVMAYSIFMVLNLNAYHIRSTFFPDPSAAL